MREKRALLPCSLFSAESADLGTPHRDFWKLELPATFATALSLEKRGTDVAADYIAGGR